MARFKKFLLDYALYIIFAIGLLRFAMTYRVGGAYREEELMAAGGSLALIIVFIYIQWDAQRKAAAHALGLTVAAYDLAASNEKTADALAQSHVLTAEELRCIACEKQKAADRARDVAEKR